MNDVTASLLTEVCHNVATEPALQPLSGESLHPATFANVADNTCFDICAIGFNVGDFHSNTPNNHSMSLAGAY